MLSTFNPRWRRSRIAALVTGYPCSFTQSDLDFEWSRIHAVSPYHDPDDRGHGFAIEEYVTLDGRTGWLERPIPRRYPLRIMHALANMLLERIDRSACGMSYGLVARVPR